MSATQGTILVVTADTAGVGALARRAASGWPRGLELRLADDHEAIGPDCALALLWGYPRVVPPAVLARCGGPVAVFHSSDLPQGRGFAPIYETIASGRAVHTVTLCHAVAAVDTGNILVKARIPVAANYTAGLLRGLGRRTIAFLAGRYAPLLAQDRPPGTPQQGPASTVPRRTPAQNELDPARTLGEQIPHLLACEDGHPTFFRHRGELFTVRVEPANTAVSARIEVEEYLFGGPGQRYAIDLDKESAP